ncbi:MAG: hypothetical protein AAFQ43_09020 [Bacteroidota bacterium]
MRLLGLAVVLLLAVCSAPPEASGVEPRPIPERIVDDVRVVGFFDAQAVRNILALVRAETDEPILSIGLPTEIFMPWYYGETDTLPTDQAEVMTGHTCDGRCGSGQMYWLSLDDEVWTVIGTGAWRG